MTSQSTTDPSDMMEVNREDRKKLAYRLLIELLSYQLASPVRWIETQYELLQNKAHIRRFVEIGPRTTLASMAKRSAAKHYAPYAPSQWSHLEFLSYNDNKKEIMYEYSSTEFQSKPDPDLPSPEKITPSSAIVPMFPVLDTPSEQISIHDPALSSTISPSADIALSARHIVLAMVAQKLRRPFDQISMEKTIRDLSGGKSTLQNEITGDLVAEFARVPDGMEDMSLTTLGEVLQGGFTGRPGKQMSTLISRFVSSKMPAGFNLNAIQDHIQFCWGLSKSHSIIPICFATTIEPPSRLSNVDGAQNYFNTIISRYASFQAFTFVAAGGQSNTSSAGLGSSSVVATSASLKASNKEQRDYHHKQFNLLAKYLQIDQQTYGEIMAESLATKVSELEENLGRWSAEFEDQFLQGIQSIFDPRQARKYDSWWNWVREDLVKSITDPSWACINVTPHGMDDRMRRILNRWEPNCADIVTASLASPSTVPYMISQGASFDNLRNFCSEIIQRGAEAIDPIFIFTRPPLGPKTIISNSCQWEYTETPRGYQKYSDVVRQGRLNAANGTTIIPFVHLQTRLDEQGWVYNPAATEILHATLDKGVTRGFTYAGKAVLVTGAGPDSIGAHVIEGLLTGGARIIVTTSRAISSSAKFYQDMYRQYGARGSTLTVLPMNQASKQDCEALIEYIYGSDSPTGGDLDFVIPFAAIPQNGEPDKLGSRQELALRAMLTNILRLVGLVRREKEKRRIDTQPTMVVLPMSCNEGTFGGDGLYAESKIGLKTLFNRFYSESWSEYLTICGAVIGWTRGTGLMRSTNILAEEVEKMGVITFTQAEMAFNILSLMTPSITVLAEDSPVYADLTGGFGAMWKIKDKISATRKKLVDELQLWNALADEDARHRAAIVGQQQTQTKQGTKICRRANLSLGFPPLVNYQDMTAIIPNLQGMIDLSHVVVVVGFSELGPWGNARTRWEMEHQGKFTLEGYLEIAWIMGLIKHADGELNGQPYVGWIDSETNSPVQDNEIPQKYHGRIMSNTGLRLIEPEEQGSYQDSYDPSRKEYMHEVAIEEDLPPFESSKSTAEAFKLRHGDHVAVQRIPESDDYRVFVKKGAVLMIPKTVPFDQVVAGSLPGGWDPLRYGIPQDIVHQVDPITLYALCCVSEAFLSAGIKDPYEIYQYLHVSELANCLGTGAGPMKAIQDMYRERFLDRPVRGDIIQEHFLNTMGAWVNMLLLSATGPLKTPVGACATAIESLDTGCDAIQSGKCKMAIVGGSDDYREELAYEFASIKATANSTNELARGRLPSEISRPTTSSRSGFAESAGCGVQILINAETALEMGLPIYGIVAYSQMASDQIGRSIPAPGKGILTVARETVEARYSQFLDLDFRRANFDEEVADIQRRCSTTQFARMQNPDVSTSKRIDLALEQILKQQIGDAQRRWANNIRLQEPAIAPIKAALATWGLTIDDIHVISMHGTSTKANEINEGEVVNTQMTHLGRRKGKPLLVVCQKSLTGHPKAAAGAWQLNGCLQMIRDGIVPGNRNADNVDEQLRRFEHLVYPMDSIRISEIKATMLTSFGFGQKGGITVTVAPKYLFASITPGAFDKYKACVAKRRRAATSAFVSRLLKNSIVQVKHDAPWDSHETMKNVFLNPNSRLVKGKFNFVSRLQEQNTCSQIPIKANEPKTTGIHDRSDQITNLVQTVLERVGPESNSSSTYNIGVDVEDVESINLDDDIFFERNFTTVEREYCSSAPNPRASFAGRWSAKEAVFKSLQTPSVGAGVAMDEIEIVSEMGIPKVILYGYAKQIAVSKSISNIEVTISHSDETSVAVALATVDGR